MSIRLVTDPSRLKATGSPGITTGAWSVGFSVRLRSGLPVDGYQDFVTFGDADLDTSNYLWIGCHDSGSDGAPGAIQVKLQVPKVGTDDWHNVEVE